MFSEFVQRFSHELENAMPSLKGLLPKREIQIAIQSVLAKMELVTREEFDAQAAVLQRTRAKLEALEQHCAEIEQALAEKK